MKRLILAIILLATPASAFESGDEGVIQVVCAEADPVMRVIKAAEQDILEANEVLRWFVANGMCLSITVPVRLVDRLYVTKDASGQAVEMWSLVIIGADRLLYSWAFPQRHRNQGA